MMNHSYQTLFCLFLALAGSGCEGPHEPVVIYTCKDPDYDHKDKDGNPDPCHENDEKKPMACGAACADVVLGVKAVPVALWIGEERALPACPKSMPKADFNGGAGILAPHACPECRCTEPACAFGPVLAFDNDACGGAVVGAAIPPPAWDGACQAAPSLPIPALGSYSFEPTEVGGCAVAEDPLPPPPHFGSSSMWETTARACRHEDDATCPPGQPCGLRDEELPSGFRSCLRLEGTSPEGAACPADFPESFVFYADVDEGRGCTPCECAPAGDAVCVSVMNLHQQADCSDATMLAWPVDGLGYCGDPSMPTNIQGVSAFWLQNEPGTCVASGGAVTGEIKAIEPAVFCCNTPAAE
ncbi:hypothetical protein [Polyangium fumosum]|uniref:Uncharacterized protein n=1 Tax=Polyangium fumosum TaxID=889272 RepID=A0A4U1JB91_9BACT|nr:hypothetical protein [Polyangium fumosum]TKD05177.1 hypothetical protein E8A74_21805 [Polyangium fumosum]